MATQKRDVRSGESVWQEPALQGFPLARDLEIDVLVVGGGVTGAMIAEALSKHFSVAVVDRRGAARGSTVASTGLLLFEIDTPLIELRKKIGRERADRAWLRSDRAMRALVEKIRQLEIDCGLLARRSVYLPGSTLDGNGLQREAEARAECGLPSIWIGKNELEARFAISEAGAVVSENSAEADPVRFALGFLRCAISRGTQFFARVDIVGVDASGDKVVAKTSEGLHIVARHVVFATGYEVPDYVRMQQHEIASTWAVATVPQRKQPWSENALIWEAADPYCYLRTTRDGRVVVGGGDEDFDDEEKRKKLTPAKARMLRRKMRKLFPHLDAPLEFVWSGAFGGSSTGLPSIGAIPGIPHCYAVLGFGGNGMTYAMIGAEIIERLVRGKSDPDEDLFAFKK